MKLTTCLSASLFVVLAACGGDEGGGLITVNEGGTIDVGSSSIVIPPNAVDTDTEVTASYASLSDYGPLEGGRDRVLVFEPALTLSAAAEIVLDPGDPRPDAQQEYAILYQFGDGDWYPVQASTIINTDGNVEGVLTWLGPTAVVITTADIASAN